MFVEHGGKVHAARVDADGVGQIRKRVALGGHFTQTGGKQIDVVIFGGLYIADVVVNIHGDNVACGGMVNVVSVVHKQRGLLGVFDLAFGHHGYFFEVGFAVGGVLPFHEFFCVV